MKRFVTLALVLALAGCAGRRDDGAGGLWKIPLCKAEGRC